MILLRREGVAEVTAVATDVEGVSQVDSEAGEVTADEVEMMMDVVDATDGQECQILMTSEHW